uniref:C2H2-type domain-containing protein n=1 Tax=Timema genevievae TaxID=629358 RepID=A0A7R9K490_TIMGE|nr:unnamed protein product [Timema genevievae]
METQIAPDDDSTTEHNNTKQNLISTLQRKYRCNICNKDFKEKRSLNSHLLVHSEQRKYKCDVCDKSFKTKSHLNRHLLIHSEQRKYKLAMIDAKPPEDSKECINEKLQNNDLNIINFLPIKEEGSKDCINEYKQNNELQLSSTTSFPPIKEEIKNIFRCGDVFRFFFHFFLPLFIAGLLLLPDYIGIVEDAPNCDVIVCCYVLLIHVVLG